MKIFSHRMMSGFSSWPKVTKRSSKSIFEARENVFLRDFRRFRATKPSAVGKRRMSTADQGKLNDQAAVNGHGDSMGNLTERLVQALIEDQQHTKGAGLGDDRVTDVKLRAELLNGTTSPNKALVKSLHLGNWQVLEKRIRKELLLHGLLESESESGDGDHDDTNNNTDEDEVEHELAQRQADLQTVAAMNAAALKQLSKAADKAVLVQQARATANHTQTAVMNLFSSFYRAVPKRKPTNKKERDQLLAALEANRKALKQLDKIDR